MPCIEHCSSPEEPCISKEGCVEELRAQDAAVYGMQRKDRLPFQIFPDPVEAVSCLDGSLSCREQGKERLPSIVVEPTDVSEVESGELRWPPEEDDYEEDEDLFLEQCIPPANIADWGEEEEEEEEESSFIIHQQQGTSLLDLQSDDFRDDTPTLPPEGAPALN
ncbi:uncharacterized protein lbhl [Hoplias malabaricus]|uniref:uncharacterized protein lbhl n=1 Tax=Hoplias malabaricus TaxID=27720 RepID=UPI0034634D1F